MQHLNGKKMVCIDTETTGLDPRYNEIWQLCMLPLDNNLRPDKKHLPLLLLIRPEHPEYIDWNVPVFKKNRAKIMEALERGYDRETAVDLMEQWIVKLGQPVHGSGHPYKLEPLGQNYAFDKAFLEQLMTVDRYQELFDYHYRDLMHAALFLNDRAAFHAEKVPFNKVNLNWLCNKLGVVNADSHDALADCCATSECYRLLCCQGLF
jgi:DNA polymerase III epsilon subunit-like protein